jgi:hydrogenase expression/formation protein HypD
MTAVRLATQLPEKQVVFVAVGFETTAPATAAAILEAAGAGLKNFSVLAAHKLVVPAMMALLANGDSRLDGFLCPGHVSVIIGSSAYRTVVEQHHVPCVMTGFEPPGILKGIIALLRQILSNEARLENVYSAVVSPEGNQVARAMLDRVFEIADAPWRAMGTIPRSGLSICDEFASFDALRRFHLHLSEDRDLPGCRCGEVIQGRVEPVECALFAKTCTPMNPIGPCMVGSEGTCSAWFKYHRRTYPSRMSPVLAAVAELTS